jgi:broad specificity phosphatase PhoE
VSTIWFITHPDVQIDPDVPVPRWPLSERGRTRMRMFLDKDWVAGLAAIWSSTEQKAIDGATILAGGRGIPRHELEELGENDRSATGYLARAEFEATADRFFAEPHESVRGWERAVDAQARIVRAVDEVIRLHGTACDLAIVAHGGVGTLLLCHLKACPIQRSEDQPPNNGGNYFAFDAQYRILHHGWQAVDGRE